MAQCEQCIQIKKNDKKKVKRKGKGETNGACVRVSGEREREKGKKSFYFSLISTEIGPSVFVRVRGKVGLR